MLARLADTRAVVARNESGPRYLTKGPEIRAFRLSGPDRLGMERAPSGHQFIRESDGVATWISFATGSTRLGIKLDTVLQRSNSQPA